MVSTPEERILYLDIQKKLYYIIPEKWDVIYLYASIIDVPHQKPIGEMYFYYLPSGIIKKKYVNGYEIPNIFNIDDEQYSKLITEVYNSIKLLRENFRANRGKSWSNITITIANNEFKIEFLYEDLKKSPYDSYERHVIWRHNYLKEDEEILSHKDKKIIDSYLKMMSLQKPPAKEIYREGVYKKPVKNIIDYERTLTVDEAIARSNKFFKAEEQKSEEKKIETKVLKKETDTIKVKPKPKFIIPKKKKVPINPFVKKKNKLDDIIVDDEEVLKQDSTFNDQIKKMKK